MKLINLSSSVLISKIMRTSRKLTHMRWRKERNNVSLLDLKVCRPALWKTDMPESGMHVGNVTYNLAEITRSVNCFISFLLIYGLWILTQTYSIRKVKFKIIKHQRQHNTRTVLMPGLRFHGASAKIVCNNTRELRTIRLYLKDLVRLDI